MSQSALAQPLDRGAHHESGQTSAVARGLRLHRRMRRRGPTVRRTPRRLIHAIAPSIDGAFDCDPNARAAAARDFGHILHKEPRAVVRPASVRDIGSLMRWAAERGIGVAARGQGHSTYGRSMAEDGIVIDMSAISTVHAVEPDRIVVDAGATWRQRAGRHAGARSDAAGADQLSRPFGRRHDCGRRNRRVVVPLGHADRSCS